MASHPQAPSSDSSPNSSSLGPRVPLGAGGVGQDEVVCLGRTSFLGLQKTNRVPKLEPTARAADCGPGLPPSFRVLACRMEKSTRDNSCVKWCLPWMAYDASHRGGRHTAASSASTAGPIKAGLRFNQNSQAQPASGLLTDSKPGVTLLPEPKDSLDHKGRVHSRAAGQAPAAADTLSLRSRDTSHSWVHCTPAATSHPGVPAWLSLFLEATGSQE